MSEFLEQRIVIKFCVALGWNFTQIWTSLASCFTQLLCDASIYKWMGKFWKGHTSVVDKPRGSKPRTGCSKVNIRKVEDLIAADCRVTVRELSVCTKIPCSTVQRIIKCDLKLTKKCAKFVPHDLTDKQKERHATVCDFWVCLVDHTPRILRCIVTTDESWIYLYDPQLKQQDKEWLRSGEPRPQKLCREIATGKIMIITFFDAHGLIYYEYVQRPQTVNQKVFRDIFTRFHEAYLHRRPNCAVRGRRFIHMDNASPHTTDLTVQLIRRLGWTCLPHHPTAWTWHQTISGCSPG